MKKVKNVFLRTKAMLSCLAILCVRCLAVTLRANLGKIDRQYTNHALRDGGIRILEKVSATYKASYCDDFKYLENKPRIYMSNHLSLFDTPLFYATINDTIRIVTKKELTRAPILGKAILSSEHVIIDRKIPAKSQNFYQNAREKLANGISLWIFPEGTRSQGEQLPFKIGGFRLAHETGAQIIPVGIVGTDKILRTKKALPHLNQNIEIRVGKPVDASTAKSAEAQKALMEQVAQTIKTLASLRTE
jgi:1-acyl-sn-glycerol-3-phosphate acyltransferase